MCLRLLYLRCCKVSTTKAQMIHISVVSAGQNAKIGFQRPLFCNKLQQAATAENIPERTGKDGVGSSNLPDSSKKNDTRFACRSFWYVPLPALWIESEEQVSLYRLAWPKMVFSSPRRSIHIYQHRFFREKIVLRAAAYSRGHICLLKGYFLDIAQVCEN